MSVNRYCLRYCINLKFFLIYPTDTLSNHFVTLMEYFLKENLGITHYNCNWQTIYLVNQ